MKFSKVCVVAVPIDRLWAYLIDARAVSGCMPGIEEFREIAADRFEGLVRLSVGPITMRLRGEVAVLERDQAQWLSRMSARARDAKIGGDVTAVFAIQLFPAGDRETRFQIDTEAKVLGRLGEFGQPIMKKTADRYVGQFVDNVVRAIETSSS